ncbi:MAG: hypothetical protein LBQ42_03595, partial [Synergistaceae bacterium]|nr:hypothetical protein [Synergistaceae bacterium]
MKMNPPIGNKNVLARVALVGVIFIAVAFFYGLSGMSARRRDLLHTDLMTSSAYVKRGFEPAYASLKNPELTDWDWLLPPNHGESILMSRLPGARGAAFEFLSPRMRRIEDYTIFIPFELDREKIDALYSDNPITPGMYLAGIGENWEIYINGDAIAKRRYVNSRGEITSFRSQRGVSIPFDKKFLNEGENFLVIYIIGAQSGADTGLFYTGPYYIGDYTKISSSGESFLTVALCTAYIFLGFYHILLYFLRKTDSYNLLYGIFSNLLAVYFFAHSPVIYNIFENTETTRRIEFAALCLLVFALAAFLETLSFGRLKRPTIAYGALCFVLIVLQSIATIWFAGNLLMIWWVCAVAYVLYIVSHDVAYTFVRHVLERREAERGDAGAFRLARLFLRSLFDSESGNTLALTIIVVCTSLFDILNSAFFHEDILLTRYSFFFFMLCMAFVLARK